MFVSRFFGKILVQNETEKKEPLVVGTGGLQKRTKVSSKGSKECRCLYHLWSGKKEFTVGQGIVLVVDWRLLWCTGTGARSLLWVEGRRKRKSGKLLFLDTLLF